MSGNLVEKTLTDENGTGYVTMLVPQDISGIKITVRKEYPRFYEGYGWPLRYLITFRSPQGRYQMGVFSGRSFLDDHLLQFDEEYVDEYGAYLKHFPGFADYVDEFAAACNPGKDLRFIRQINDPNEQQLNEKGKAAVENSFEKSEDLYSLLNYMNTRADRLYSYSESGREKYICYSMAMEAFQYARWVSAPDGDPQKLSREYPYIYYDERLGRNLYAGQYETNWSVSQITGLLCDASDFEEAYRDFSAITANGQKLHPDIRKALRDYGSEIDKNLKAKREKERIIRQQEAERIEEEKAKQKIWQDYEAEKRERDWQLYEYVRNTQQDIADIHNSSYSSHNDMWDRMSEGWSDTFRGNTRFTDRQGKEYVIHTTDDHAYKSGNTFVTSDRPLDHTLDWEELKKKKY